MSIITKGLDVLTWICMFLAIVAGVFLILLILNVGQSIIFQATSSDEGSFRYKYVDYLGEEGEANYCYRPRERSSYCLKYTNNETIEVVRFWENDR